MKTRTLIFVGLLCAAVAGGTSAADNPVPEPEPGTTVKPADGEKTNKPCKQCGVIEAVVPRVVSSGPNGFFTYALVIRMDQTGLRRNITVSTVGPMNVGDRVRVMGGTVQPLM